MTGHDDQRIVSDSPDMMPSRTGSPDIMSRGSDLRKLSPSAALDMMTGSGATLIVDHCDLRKHPVRPDLGVLADMMSGSLLPTTARSGRRTP